MTNPRATLPKSPSFRSTSPARLGNRRGIALISVLAVLILLTVLVVAFLIRAEVARTSSANYRATTETRLLADTVLNLVQAEINDATTYGLTRSGGPYTWASQPGAIRVYDTTGGASVRIYRLYSAPSLSTSTISDLLDANGNTTEIPSDWASNPAKYVDLNAPVNVTDPSNTASNFLVYPILDNRNPTNTAQAVKLPGFYVNATGTSTYPATLAAANLSSPNQPVMPVQWLYVLANGQIIAPDSTSSGSTATFTTASSQPSTTNPIVGRIAYWTDDDTCKININTAGGSVAYRTYTNGTTPVTVNDGNGTTGIFFTLGGISGGQGAQAGVSWDTPRFGGSWDDLKLFANDQPVSGEYQRYPGHPATTILYYLLYALGVNVPEAYGGAQNGFALGYSGTPAGNASDTQHGGNAMWLHTSSLYGLLPRYNDDGGSQAGIADTTYIGTPTTPTTTRKRLYTSLGELLYSTSTTGTAPPVRTQNGTLTGTTTTPITPFLTRQQIETGKFFMTAHSRAPEVTLFGTPRVAMWPIPDTSQTAPRGTGTTMAITAIDKLIKFCSTTNTGNAQAGNPYYFQRYDAYSATNDYNNEPRNQAVYGYLQNLTAANIPGYGGNFLSKYGSSSISTIASERDQILTEMIDYIRCLNLNDHSWPNSTPTSGVNYAAKGEVIPLQITKSGYTTQGLGRLATLSEIGLHVICTADGSNNLATLNTSNSNTGYSATITGSNVSYNVPVIVATISATIPVSPVIGSANDPGYVSNLPEQQYLRNSSNQIVDIFGNVLTSTVDSTVNPPFPLNPTLSNDTLYHTPAYARTDSGTFSALAVGAKKLQAMLLFEPAAPLNGYDLMAQTSGGVGPDFNILVSGGHSISIAGQQPFQSTPVNTTGANSNGDGYLNGSSSTATAWSDNSEQGGILSFRGGIINNSGSPTTHPPTHLPYMRYNGWSGVSALIQKDYSAASTNPPSVLNGTGTNTYLTQNGRGDTLGTGVATQYIVNPSTGGRPYHFVSNPFTVTSSTIVVGGSSTFSVSMTMPVTTGSSIAQVPYQNFTVGFPAITVTTPTLATYGFTSVSGTNSTVTHAPDWWGFDNRIGWCGSGSANNTGASSVALGLGCEIRGDLAPPGSGWGSGTAWLNYTGTTTIASSLTTTSSGTTAYGDVVRSIVPKDCDYRLTMAKATINASPSLSSSTGDFMVTPQYSSTRMLDNMFCEPLTNSQCTAGTEANGSLVNLGAIIQCPSLTPKVPYNYLYTSATGVPGDASNRGYLTSGDWDNGTLLGPDGCYANKADEGTAYSAGGTPYINYNAGNNNSAQLPSYFTANRIVTSPVAFGSLPTGVAEGIPWRTLLFRPQMTTTQTGSATVGRNSVASPAGPKDYLLLDNFWMPIVQPYAISEPFSTAGKINMNYQILPFTHIIRSTGVQAVLASELIARIPVGGAAAAGGSSKAKFGYSTKGTTQTNIVSNWGGSLLGARLPLNLSEDKGSLRQFREKFKSGDIFRSPAEICDIYLVPRDITTAANAATKYLDWTSNDDADYRQADSWYGSAGDFALVGDNTRERPYADIYPRLTTKSNTYTVYYRVQVLKNPPAANQAQWSETSGVVTGEYRGSTSLERYLDPNNNTLPDFTDSSHNPASTATAPSLDSFYQWRTVSNYAFAP